MARPIFDRIHQGKKRAFLEAFVRLGNVSKSAELAGIERSTHYVWMREQAYREEFEKAEIAAARLLEDEAFRRAHDGVRRPVLYEGKQVILKRTETKPDGTVIEIEEPLFEHEYSDVLLIFLLKGLKPNRYRDRASVELTGKDGAALFTLADNDRLISEHESQLRLLESGG